MWALDLNNQMIERNLVLLEELLEQRPIPVDRNILETRQHRTELNEIAIEMVRTELFELVPSNESTAEVGELPF